MPETKGRSYEELDLMFAAKLPTRKFPNFYVNAYEEGDEVRLRTSKVDAGAA